MIKPKISSRVIMGILLAGICAGIFVGCYGFFLNSTNNTAADSFLEQESIINSLYEANQVLHRDLYNLENSASLSYLQLYYPCTPAMKATIAASDPSYYKETISSSEASIDTSPDAGDTSLASPDNPSAADDTSLEEEIASDTNIAQAGEESFTDSRSLLEDEDTQEEAAEANYTYIRQAYSVLMNYFTACDNLFSQVNASYDYMIRDTVTGRFLTNSEWTDSMPSDPYYFYLSFVYDENGNVTIATTLHSQNPDRVRKIANELLRKNNPASDSVLTTENLSSQILSGFRSCTVRQYPTNCEITYALTEDAWHSLQNGISSNTINYTASEDSLSIWYGIADRSFPTTGVAMFYLGLILFMLLCGIFFPLSQSAALPKTNSWYRLPFEVVLLGLIILLAVNSPITDLVWNTVTGVLAQNYANATGIYLHDAETLLYFLNYALLSALFFLSWYCGMNLRRVREMGAGSYIREKSLFYRIFPFLKSKSQAYYNTLQHFDVTRNAKKTIIKLVLINAVILFIIGSLWMGGFGITVVYSLLLYFLLKKYVSDLQKKYSILLSATNEIAMGNLNVEIREDLGVFEPFKPQIIRIQEGFKRAVEEETKSQRMKSELITNVSHDLKTPLTAIITYTDLLKDENLTLEKRREYLDTLERKSLRLKVLIEDLFEVSKANSKNVQLNIMNVDILNLVKQVALEMSDKLDSAHLDVRMNFEDKKVILPLDSQKTFRIYENLFGNISKYAMPGTRVYVNGYTTEDSVILTLKNISAQEIKVAPEELTDRFVRGDASRNTEGSGLGLAIAKSFTELQGGQLTIEIDGDLFKVTTLWKLPCEASETPPQQSPAVYS